MDDLTLAELPPVSVLAEATSAVTGLEVVETLWSLDQLSRVAAFRLADGEVVVAKARPSGPRLGACIRAQAAAAAAGIPCPVPLGSTVRGGWSVAVEEHLPGGTPRTVAQTGVQPLVDVWLRLDEAVGGLAEPGVVGVDGGRAQPAPPPWADPLHPGPETWPERDPRLPALGTDRSVPWLWTAAERVRRRVSGVDLPVRVGHLDLYTSNLRWREGAGSGPGDLVSLDDWDSLGALPEPMLVGQTAGVYTTTREPFTAPTIEQSREFLQRWLATSGRSWGREEWELAWAGGLWTTVFDAQDGLAHGNAHGLEQARGSIEELLALAGA